MTRRRPLVVLVALLIAPAVHAQSKSPPDVVQIDGSKHPEMVPNWAAWLDAFSSMTEVDPLGIPTIPSTVWFCTSEAERNMLRRESLAIVRAQREAHEDAMPLRKGLTSENAPDRQTRADEMELAFRRKILAARNRVLAGLNPQAQGALQDFVEHMRHGFSATVPTSRIAFFRSPE